MDLINKIDSEIKANGGFTLTLNGNKHKHKTGFAVSITNNKASDIKKALGQLYTMPLSIKNYKIYLGGWRDIKTNIVYIDYTIIIKNKNLALKTGALFNQTAIYNIKAKDSIYLKTA